MSPVAKISRVLVGVDFDEASASALKMAGVLAVDLGCRHHRLPFGDTGSARLFHRGSDRGA